MSAADVRDDGVERDRTHVFQTRAPRVTSTTLCTSRTRADADARHDGHLRQPLVLDDGHERRLDLPARQHVCAARGRRVGQQLDLARADARAQSSR